MSTLPEPMATTSISAPLTPPFRLQLQRAAWVTLAALVLCIPLLLLRLGVDISNRPLVTPRFMAVATALLIAWSIGLRYRMLGFKSHWPGELAYLAACSVVIYFLVATIWGLWGVASGGTTPVGATVLLSIALAAASHGPAVGEFLLALITLGIGLAAITTIGYAVSQFRDRLQAPTHTPVSFDTTALYKRLSVGGLALLFLYPILALSIVGQSGAIKWVDNFGVQIMIYIMLGWGLNIVVGLAGLLDLGYVAFYAVGAYAYALIATQVIPATFPALGVWAFWICLPIAGILAALWGVILGFPVLRLKGDYLAIVTLAFGEIIRLVLINWVEVTKGDTGILTPRITFFGIPFASATGDRTFAETFGLSGSPTIYRAIFLYYVILLLALLTAVVTLRLRRLPVGRAWEALREDEIACRSLGINTTNTKLTAFAIGAGFGGFAGAFFAARQGFVNPKSFEFIESATILAFVVLGGMGSLLGVALAAVVMIGGTELLRELEWTKKIFGPGFDPAQYRMLIFGVAMVLMMMWKPRGLISTREPSIILRESRAVSGSLVKEGHG